MYQDTVDRIISQNNKEKKAINDQIADIEQRVKSEKVLLLEKIAELEENK